MSDIPPDLFPNILSRVPAVCLLRFRCVSKAWRRMIDDPTFIKLHHHRQTDAGYLIFSNDTGTEHYALSLDSLYHSSKTLTRTVVVAPPLKALIRHDVSHMPNLPLPSCKGVILVPKSIENVWALWNPFTGEVHELPSCNTEAQFKYIGFWYDSVADDYKVLKIGEYYDIPARDYSSKTLIYSLKSNSWRRVEDLPYYHCFRVPGVFVNGALHWTSEVCWNFSMRGEEERLILAFDIATERYHFLPLPSVLSRPCGSSSSKILDALGECLLLTWYDSVYRLDDYGGKNSWIKLFSFHGMGLGNARPIAYLKIKGEVLVRGDANVYFWFDVEKNSAKKVSIDGAPDCCFAQFCLASLVRLSNGGGVDENSAATGTAKRKRKRTDDRLKLTLTTSAVRSSTTSAVRTLTTTTVRTFNDLMNSFFGH